MRLRRATCARLPRLPMAAVEARAQEAAAEWVELLGDSVEELSAAVAALR